MPRVSFAAFGMVILGLTGCGGPEGPIRYPVDGTVLYKGGPLPRGVIRFEPDVMNNDGPAGYAMIANGKFDTRNQGGVAPISGLHTIVIEGFDGIPGPEQPFGKTLFGNFRVTVELPPHPSSHTFTVPDDAQ